MIKPLQLLIPAAGKGSRFADAGFDLPKPLIPIWEIPMLIWVISNFPLSTGDQIRVLCQKNHNIPGALSEYRKRLPNKIDFIEIDYWTEGPAHSLELLLEGIHDSSPVVCANSDQYIFAGLPEYVDAVRRGRSKGQILTMEATSNSWSYIGRDLNGKVNRVVEKEEISNEATVGVYGWDSAATLRAALAWQRDKGLRVNNEYYVAPSYQYLIENNLEISTHSVGEHGFGVHGLGIPKDLDHFLTLETAKGIHQKFFSAFK
jgi:NDP-sugar pyrophosphorylase family protein